MGGDLEVGNIVFQVLTVQPASFSSTCGNTRDINAASATGDVKILNVISFVFFTEERLFCAVFSIDISVP